MKRTARLSCVATTVGAVAVLGAGSASWACSADAHLNSISPGVAQQGQVVAVSGGQFVGATELHWQTVNGPILATAPYGGSFTQDVPLPVDATVGFHTIVGVAHRADGTIIGQGAGSLEVTARDPATTTTPPTGAGTTTDDGITTGDPTGLVNDQPSTLTLTPGPTTQNGTQTPVTPPNVVVPVAPPGAGLPAGNVAPVTPPTAGSRPSTLTATPVTPPPADQATSPLSAPAAAPVTDVRRPGAVAAPLTGAVATGRPASLVGGVTPTFDLAEAAKVDPWVPAPTSPSATPVARPASLLDTGHHKTGGPLHLGLILLSIGLPGLFAAAIAYELLRSTTRAKLRRS